MFYVHKIFDWRTLNTQAKRKKNGFRNIGIQLKIYIYIIGRNTNHFQMALENRPKYESRVSILLIDCQLGIDLMVKWYIACVVSMASIIFDRIWVYIKRIWNICFSIQKYGLKEWQFMMRDMIWWLKMK